MTDVQPDPTGFTPAEQAELDAIEKEQGKLVPAGKPEVPAKEAAPLQKEEEPQIAPKEEEEVKPESKPEPPKEEPEEEEEEPPKPPKMVPAWKLEQERERHQTEVADLQQKLQDIQTSTPLSQRLQATNEALKAYAKKNGVDYDSLAELREIMLPKELIEFYDSQVQAQREAEETERHNSEQLTAFNKEFASKKVVDFFKAQGLTEEQIAGLKPKLQEEAFKFPGSITLDRVYLASPDLHPRQERHTGEVSRPGTTPGKVDAKDELAERLEHFDELPDDEQAKIIAAMPNDVFEKWDNARAKGQGTELTWFDGGRQRKLIVKPLS